MRLGFGFAGFALVVSACAPAPDPRIRIPALASAWDGTYVGHRENIAARGGRGCPVTTDARIRVVNGKLIAQLGAGWEGVPIQDDGTISGQVAGNFVQGKITGKTMILMFYRSTFCDNRLTLEKVDRNQQQPPP